MRKIFLALLALSISFAIAAPEARLLRFPATNGSQVVFTYAGDLYSVDLTGGVARKLTSAIGYEMFARFSPDGKTLAFTGQYDGNTEVFTMPGDGGEPKRITYTATIGRDDIADRMGPNNIVMGWTPNGKNIALRSRMQSFNSFNGALYTVDANGGIPKQIPVPRGGFLSFSPDGNKMAYNRIFREFRTWKRYRGGMADDVWIFDLKTHRIKNLTKNPAQDIIPMWIGEKIYFLSDRDELKRMNLYVVDQNGGEAKKLTGFKDFDIKFPSASAGYIVYENGGYLYKYDTRNGKNEQLHIRIQNDMPVARTELKDVSKKISNYEIAPDGKRALLGAYGDIFTVPASEGMTYNLTATSGVHERNSKWSPDGRWIAYISDKSGEDELYIIDKTGQAPARQITTKASTYKYQMYWSPDSKKLLWADREQRLRYVDIFTKHITEVAQSKTWEMRQYGWSPDGKWVTFQKAEENGLGRIYIYSVREKKSFPVTDEWYDASNPLFSADGNYLYFISNRDFNPIYSWTEWNHAYRDMAKVYLLTLNKKTQSPFAPENDTVNSGKVKKGVKNKKNVKIDIKIDFDGIAGRVIALPIKASSYSNLGSAGDKIYYQRRGSKDDKTQLLMYDLKKKEEKDLGNVDGYEISADLKNMLVNSGKAYAIIKLPSSKIKMDKKLKLADMKIKLDKRAMWKQIFDESWRQMRSFFYAPNMHGLDWQAVHDKYAQLLPYVNHRNDLTYIIGEMIGELSVGHAYVGGGDRPRPKRIKMGLLGAEIQKDASGYFKISHILKGQNWDKALVSPLTQVGVDVNEGDYILAVDGKSVKGMPSIFQALVNTAGHQVLLTVNKKPTTKGAHTEIVVPVGDESKLYYYNWVERNIAKVNKATGGKVGYLHIPDMGRAGLNEFVKHFYPQLRKKALIVDVRGNGGGNVSPMIIERLRREAVMIDFARNTTPQTDPGQMIYGPIIALADEFSASDGDIFTYRFKKDHLGKVVGKRTWGGVVGIRGSLPFIDGGSLHKPEFSRYSLDGKKWIMEGHGVEPDIYVDNDPYQEYTGNDQQLNRAIKEIMDELKTQEKTIPPIPAYPDKH